jgi:hypothetical protein
MVNKPNNNAFFLPTPSASTVLIGMHNKSTFSHINLAKRETNVIKESFTLTISISSHFHPCLSPLTNLATPLANTSKLNQALTSPSYQSSSFHYGWQEFAALFFNIKGQSKTPFTQVNGL